MLLSFRQRWTIVACILALLAFAKATTTGQDVDLLTLNNANGFKILGAAVNEQAGFMVSSAGDVNKDGIDDIIVKTNTYLYVLFGNGSANFPNVNFASMVTGRNTGFQIRANRGCRAGDVNGDGIQDILVGVIAFALVVFGKDSTAPGSVVADISFQSDTTFPTSASTGFRIYGVSGDNSAGTSLACAGDVNGDGVDDMLVGANLNDPPNSVGGVVRTDAGIVYVVFGRKVGVGGVSAFSNINLQSFNGVYSAGFRILGAVTLDRLGSTWTSVAGAGDVNADTVQDIIVGAPAATRNGQPGRGESYVIFGRHVILGAAAYSDIDLSVVEPRYFRVTSGTRSENGYAVSSAGDVNGDGIADVIVGAGIVYVIFGRSSELGLEASTDIALSEIVTGSSLGFRMLGASGRAVSRAGDVNGDGMDDVIIGAYQNTFTVSGVSRSGAGAAYVVFGRNVTGGARPFADLNLLTIVYGSTAGFRILGAAATDQCGISVSGGIDFNDDGLSDLLVGANLADPSTLAAGSNGGSAYVIYGAISAPTSQPSTQPTGQPSAQPAARPSRQPSSQPSARPSAQPWSRPSAQPSTQPSCKPSTQPSSDPSQQPSVQPSGRPSSQPSSSPSAQPTVQPSAAPSQPSSQPSAQPSNGPSARPSGQPSSQPSCQPSSVPTAQPSSQPSSPPSQQPSSQPSSVPTAQPSLQPSSQPSQQPSSQPSQQPSSQPSSVPTAQPSLQPSSQPSQQPTWQPSSRPSVKPSSRPSRQPSPQPSSQPSDKPSGQPSAQPSQQPLTAPSASPSGLPSAGPTAQPSSHPTPLPSAPPSPSSTHSGPSTAPPTVQPSESPSGSPVTSSSALPSASSTNQSCVPSTMPSLSPSLATTSREWATVIEGAQLQRISVINDQVWVCGGGGNNTTSVCVLLDPLTGRLTMSYPFSVWASIGANPFSTTSTGGSVVVTGRADGAALVAAETGNCAIWDTYLFCDVKSFADARFLAASYVPYPNRMVYIGTYNVHVSATIIDVIPDTVRSFIYTLFNLKSVVLSQAQSPPSFVGTLVAGTAVRSAGSPVNCIVVGFLRTDNGVLSAMSMVPVTGDIINNAELVTASALEITGPDSFLVGALVLSDGAGKHAYLLRGNALYSIINYCICFRATDDEVNSEHRRLTGASHAHSVARGVVYADHNIYIILAYTRRNTTSLAVLKVSAHGNIVAQVEIGAPGAALQCTGITATAAYLAIACNVVYHNNTQQAVVLSGSKELSFSALPSGFTRNTRALFYSQSVPLKRTVVSVTTSSTKIAMTEYRFNTADGTPSRRPSVAPTSQPSSQPLSAPSAQPSRSPTASPSVSARPTSQPSTASPTNTHKPSAAPTPNPTATPSVTRTARPSAKPSAAPTARPTATPSLKPSTSPTGMPSFRPTPVPAAAPTRSPRNTPSAPPDRVPSVAPTAAPTMEDQKESSNRSTVIWSCVGGALLLCACGYLLYQYRVHVVEEDAKAKRKVVYFAHQEMLVRALEKEREEMMEQIRLEDAWKEKSRKKTRDTALAAAAMGTGAHAMGVARPSSPLHQPPHTVTPAPQLVHGGSGSAFSDSDSSVELSSLHSSEMDQFEYDEYMQYPESEIDE